MLENGKYGIIKNIIVQQLETPETTYNFEVEGYHTYYVGKKGILVHNACGTKLSNDELQAFDVMEFDQRAVDFAKQGNPSYNTFKNRLFSEQQRLNHTFDGGTKNIINGEKVILHHPLGRSGENLYNIVWVTKNNT